jgi:hypothetical protein
MDATRDFLENLQGLALFMHFKKHRAVSLRDLIYMNPAKRKQIEDEFRLCYDDVLAEHTKRSEAALNELREGAKSHFSQDASPHLTYKEIEKQLKESNEYIEQIKNGPVPSKFQEPITYNILEPLYKQVVDAASDLGVNPPLTNIILASLHTEKVNAAAIKIKESGEYIIAFESQIFSFLNRFTKIIAQSFPLINNSNGKYSFSTLNTDVINYVKSNPVIQSLFDDLILSYVIEGNVSKAHNQTLDYPNYINATYILRATELFIMGHEYGHIAKGHLQSKSDSKLEFANIAAEEINRSWEQEYEADTLGLFFTIRALFREGFQVDFALIGADLFFIISEFVEKSISIKKFGHENNVNNSDSHPSANLRRENLRKAFKTAFTEIELEKAEYLPNAIQDALQYLWNGTKIKLYKYHDSKIK